MPTKAPAKGILKKPGQRRRKKKKTVHWPVRSKLVRYFGPAP